MPQLTLDSTSLDQVDYEPVSKVLLVVFRDRSAYRYFGVSGAVFEELLKAPSKGAYFNHVIRGAYRFLPARWED